MLSLKARNPVLRKCLSYTSQALSNAPRVEICAEWHSVMMLIIAAYDA